MTELHIPEYGRAPQVPTQDAYDAACRALGTYKKRLAEQVELMHGIVENGAWVRIPDPRLRELVGRYVADAVADLAGEVGADAAQAAAEDVRRGGQLPLSVEGA